MRSLGGHGMGNAQVQGGGHNSEPSRSRIRKLGVGEGRAAHGTLPCGSSFPGLRCRQRLALVCVFAVLLSSVAAPTSAKETPAKGASDVKSSERASEYAAYRLLKKGQELLENKEYDRGIKMLVTLVTQQPRSKQGLKARLLLGRHFVSKGEHRKGLSHLAHLRALKKSDRQLQGDELDLCLEGYYQSGFAFYQMGQYRQAFPYFRTITNDHPNTVWGNQSHYYIGMCHFHQGNWGNAVNALSLVGTFVDPDSPVAQYIEAGHRFYMKLEDVDFPVLTRQGVRITASAVTKNGDKETLIFRALSAKGDVMIGSMGSEVGAARPGDGMLQVVGGDMVTVTYVDRNDKSGKHNIRRQFQVKVVSSARLSFTLGTFEKSSEAAYLNQPLFISLHDADVDLSDQSDKVTVKLIARYKAPEDEETEADAGDKANPLAEWEGEEEEIRYVVRDELTVTLQELGKAPCRTGRFGGRAGLAPAEKDKPVDKTDRVLRAAVEDEVIATFVDNLHGSGDTPRTATAKIKVVGDLDNSPRATQYVVQDPVARAEKSLVESEAFLSLGRIFKSMGLYKGAAQKCHEGLRLVDPVIRSRDALPQNYRERAFKLRWELYLVQNDYEKAIETCTLFNKLYPDSPFVDQALMGIAKMKLKKTDGVREGIRILQQVLRLKTSEAKPEAQFLIAKAIEDGSDDGMMKAVPYYKTCAERYPRSPFAGDSLSKLVNYYISTRDYPQATELLEQIFQDYPDAEWLDSMLLKWVIVAYRMGDKQKALAKCEKLLFDWPNSKHAPKAKKILEKLRVAAKSTKSNGA